MELVNFRILFVLAVLLSSCGITTPIEKPKEVLDADIKTGSLLGTLTNLEGKSIDLASSSSKIQILLFVSETCSVCRAETQSLVKLLASKGAPANVDFLSVVVGSIAPDAFDWKTSLGVSWSVAIDPNDPLFRSYCSPRLQTPCVIIRNPFLNQYKTLTGEHPISEWESFTGAWVY